MELPKSKCNKKFAFVFNAASRSPLTNTENRNFAVVSARLNLCVSEKLKFVCFVVKSLLIRKFVTENIVLKIATIKLNVRNSLINHQTFFGLRELVAFVFFLSRHNRYRLLHWNFHALAKVVAQFKQRKPVEVIKRLEARKNRAPFHDFAAQDSTFVVRARPIATRPSRRNSFMWLLNFLNCRKPKTVCAIQTKTANATKYPNMSIASLFVEHNLCGLFVGYQNVNRLPLARAHNRRNFFAGRRHSD